MTARVVTVLLVWLVVAAGGVAAGLLERIPPPYFLIGLTLVSTVAALAIPGVRRWVDGIDPRLLLLPHLVRYVGYHLLQLVARGELPPLFAAIGWGDLVAAVGATLLLGIGAPPRQYAPSWWLWALWSLLGLGDMALLVSRAVPAVLADPSQFQPFLELPMGLLPTFAVPLIITTHLLVIRRLATARP